MIHSTATSQTRQTAEPLRAPTVVMAFALLVMAASLTACVKGFKVLPIDPQSGYYEDPEAKEGGPDVAEAIVDDRLGPDPKTSMLVVQDEPPIRSGSIYSDLLSNQFTFKSVKEMGFFGEALTTTEYHERFLRQDLLRQIDARNAREMEKFNQNWKSPNRKVRDQAERKLRRKLKKRKAEELEEIRDKLVTAGEIRSWAEEHGNFLWLRWSFPGEPAEIKVDSDNKPLPEDQAKKFITRNQRASAILKCHKIRSTKNKQQCINELPPASRAITVQKMHLSLIDAASQQAYFTAEKWISLQDSGTECVGDGSINSEFAALGCRTQMPKTLTHMPGFNHAFVPTLEDHLYPLLNALIEYMSKQTGTPASPVAISPQAGEGAAGSSTQASSTPAGAEQEE